MKKIILAILFFVACAIFISCKKKPVCQDCNQAPIANAGVDQQISWPEQSISLDGKNSFDADGLIVSYQWIKISGPASFNIVAPGFGTTVIYQLVIGIYQFELTVKDNGGLIAKDTVSVTVVPAANKAPMVFLGLDQVIFLPTDSVTVDGSGSYDLDGTITSYLWTKVSGPGSSNIINASSAKTVINKLVAGTYRFQLAITDNGGLTSTRIIQIVVNPVIQYPSSVYFWTRDIIYSNNLLYISINGEIQVLDEAWGGSGTPNCYPYAGGITFYLPAGTYPYKTWRQGRDTVRGTCIVITGVCNEVQVNF